MSVLKYPVLSIWYIYFPKGRSGVTVYIRLYSSESGGSHSQCVYTRAKYRLSILQNYSSRLMPKLTESAPTVG